MVGEEQVCLPASGRCSRIVPALAKIFPVPKLSLSPPPHSQEHGGRVEMKNWPSSAPAGVLRVSNLSTLAVWGGAEHRNEESQGASVCVVCVSSVSESE